jgi:hypothetical protein
LQRNRGLTCTHAISLEVAMLNFSFSTDAPSDRRRRNAAVMPIFTKQLKARILRSAAALCLLFALVAVERGWSQGQNAGSVNGNVTDAQGGVLPGAEVTLSNDEHGFKRVVITNEVGEYVFNQVAVGEYVLTVVSPGFATYEARGVTVDANQAVHVYPKLKPGAAADSITVTDTSGSTIDTTSATLGELVDSKLVENLPVDGGNSVALAGLLPGVVNVNAPTTFTGERSGPTYTVSGSRNTQNLMLLDGSMWNNLFYNTGLNYPPRQGLQEVSVLLNNYKAQYGRNVGSIFNVITASGSNQFHGKFWEYAENSSFNAADYITQKSPHLIQNQFGATFGGPIMKNKLYFMATFQGIRVSQTAIGRATVQTNAERGMTSTGAPLPCTSGGPFTGQDCASFAIDVPSSKTTSTFMKNPLYDDSNGYVETAKSVFDTAYTVAGGNLAANQHSPCVNELMQVIGSANASNPNNANAAYLPYGEIPTVCFNPVILNVLNKYVPLPTAANTTSSGTYTYTPYPRSEYDGLFRADYTHGNHNIDARFYISDNSDIASQGVTSADIGLSGYEVLANTGTNVFGNIGDTWVVSPSLLNVLRIGYKRYTNINIPTDPTTLNQLGGIIQSFGQPTLPQFNFNLYSAGNKTEGATDIVNEDIEADDSLSWTHGKHNVQVGGSYMHLQYLNKTQNAGYIQFSTTYTGDVYADSMMGLVNNVQVSNQMNQAGIENELFAYAQDDWRIVPRLTLNMGLRYELPLVWTQPKKQSATFIPGYQSHVYPNAPAGMAFVGDPGVPRGLINTDFVGFAPRVGFSYNLTNSTSHPAVMRGGFGVFFDALNANIVGVGEPFFDRFNYVTPAGGASEPLLGDPAFPTTFDPKNPMFVGPASLYYPDKNFKTPYVMAVNFGIQQTLSSSTTLEIDYVGKFGRHLTMPYDQNPAIYDCSGAYYQANPSVYCSGANNKAASYTARSLYPSYGYGGQGLVDFASNANSSYHGLQVMYNQRASKTLTLIATYTYSRSIDLDTNGQNNTNQIPNVFNLKSERGLADGNVKQNLTTGWVYYIPKRTQGNKIVRDIVNDWQFNGTYNIHSGTPYSLKVNDDPSLSDEPNQRPVLLPGMKATLPRNRPKAQLISEYFNTAAFGYPTQGTFSNLGRNSMIGPGMVMVNFTAGRTFSLPYREGAKLAFRADGFNIFNFVNLANPNGTFSCSSTTALVSCAAPASTSQFGEILSTNGSNTSLTSNGRKVQFSLTLSY